MSIKIKYQDQNLNQGTEKGREMVDHSIQKFGMRDAVVIDKNGQIISGNHRKKAATKKGITKERIIEASFDEIIAIQYNDIDLDTPEGKELALALNQTAKFNINIDETLAIEELGEVVEEWGIEIPEEIPEASEDDFDTTPPENPITVLGDLYEIGEHRLLCGDSTDSDQVAKLMNGKKADMVFTDPPYGMNFQSNFREKTPQFSKIKNDDKILDIAPILFLLMKDNSPAYVCTRWDLYPIWFNQMADCFNIKNCIVWYKKGGGLGDLKNSYSPNHEFIIVGHKGNSQLTGKRNSDVWEIGRDGVNDYKHPTQKPVELSSFAMQNHSDNNGLIVDLFLGSGSTMVASHQLNRKCYGMELDCKYVDVIVKRMLKLDKTLKIKKNGIDETETWLKLIE